jgi:signal transduction histidine kinase
MNNIFRSDTTKGIQLIQPVKYIYPAPESPVPTDAAFEKEFYGVGIVKFLFTIGKKPVWYRIELENTKTVPLEISIRYKSPIVQPGLLLKSGDSTVSAGTPRIENGFYYQDFKLNPGKQVVYVFNRQTWSKIVFGFDFVLRKDTYDDRAEYILQKSDSIFTQVAFVVLVFFQVVYVMLQFFYHRRKEYTYYFFYLLCILLYFGVRLEFNLRFDFLKLYIPGIVPYMNDVLLILPFFFYLRFSRYFIGTAELYPKMDKQIKIVEYIILSMAFIIVLLIPLDQPYLGMIVITIFVQLLFLYSIWLIRFFYLRRNKLIRFLLIASVFAVTGHFLAITLPLIPPVVPYLTFDLLNITMIGLAFEIFFFNTGLGYKAKFEQEEKLKAQAEVINQYAQNQKIQLQLEGMRDKIANDLHDDVGSTLSSIVLYGQVALKSDQEKSKSVIEKIISSSQRMMESMSDIVWAIHSRNDAWVNLISRMKETASERLGMTGIRFTLNHDEAIEQIRFNMEARRNILLLFKEALHNAAKYSDAGSINCDLRIEGDMLLLTVQDDGKGFHPEQVIKGNGLESMKSRSQELKGTFEIESSPGKGTRITFQLPVNELSIIQNPRIT